MSELRELTNAADRAELLRRWRSEGAAGPDDWSVRRTDSDRTVAPCSIQQEIVARREFDGVVPGLFTISALLEVDAPIDAGALREAVAILCTRHETLRTLIEIDGAEMRQRIGQDSNVELVVNEDGYSTVSDAVTGGAGLIARGFDLQRGPLARVGMYQVGSSSVLAVAAHHVIADGWSLSIVLAEVAAMYQQLVNGDQPVPSPLGVQYQDFARWQRQRFGEGKWGRSSAFWQERVVDLPSPPLPFEAMPLTTTASVGAVAPLKFGRRLSDSVRATARHLDTTPFIVLLTAYRHALADLCDCRDVAVGTTVANRNGAEMERLVGYFANTLIVRAVVPPDGPGAESVAVTGTAWREAWAHRDLPLAAFRDEIVPLLRDERLPPYTAYFVLQPAMPPIDVAGAEVRFVESRTPLAKVPLALEIWDAPEFRGTLLAPATALGRAALVELASSIVRHVETITEAVLGEGGGGRL